MFYQQKKISVISYLFRYFIKCVSLESQSRHTEFETFTKACFKQTCNSYPTNNEHKKKIMQNSYRQIRAGLSGPLNFLYVGKFGQWPDNFPDLGVD